MFQMKMDTSNKTKLGGGLEWEGTSSDNKQYGGWKSFAILNKLNKCQLQWSIKVHSI